MKPARPLLAILLACACVACGDRSTTQRNGEGDPADDQALPAPRAQAGSITGMPALPPESPDRPAQPDIAVDAPPPSAQEGSDAAAPGAMQPGEPGVDAAVAAIRDYYVAINRRDYTAAYRLWRDQGQASGQSAEQFALGFQATAGVSVEIGAPGDIDAGAGQRHVEVPVQLVAHQQDGSERRYRGRYVLQRTVVDGASDEQRSWRIASARLMRIQ